MDEGKFKISHMDEGKLCHMDEGKFKISHMDEGKLSSQNKPKAQCTGLLALRAREKRVLFTFGNEERKSTVLLRFLLWTMVVGFALAAVQNWFDC